MSARLWVIDPSIEVPEREGIETVLDGWTGESRLFFPSLHPGDGPGPVTGYDTDGVVLLGSGASVYDDLAWLADLSAWVRPIVTGERPIPLLGICFGHQLVAHLAGGTIDFIEPERSKLVGVESSRLDGGRLVPGSRELTVVVSHREEVKTAPPGYSVVGRRGPIEMDALEHEILPIFTYQFHPEAREEFARRAGFPEARISDRLRRESGLVLEAFRDLVKKKAKAE